MPTPIRFAPLIATSLLALGAVAASAATMPAGNRDSDGFAAPTSSSPSSVSRQAVVDGVVQARAEGQLMPAGEGAVPETYRPTAGASLTRAQVKADVLAARASGDLMPAGQGESSERQSEQRVAAAYYAARKSPRSNGG
jgi:hypothetical protein